MNNDKLIDKVNTLSFADKLNDFIGAINSAIEIYWNISNMTFDTPPKVYVESVGRRYIRLVKYARRPHLTGPYMPNSVYAFVDVRNGDVLKAASWKAPAPNGVRTNLSATDALNKVTVFGVAYLSDAVDGGSLGVAKLLKKELMTP